MPRYPAYSSNAERQRAYRLRKAKAAAEALAENATLRRVVGADEDETLYEATEALIQADRTAPRRVSDDQEAAAFAVGYQEGYDAGYQEGYAAAASARVEDLLKAPTPQP